MVRMQDLSIRRHLVECYLGGRERFVIQVWAYRINKFDLFDLS